MSLKAIERHSRDVSDSLYSLVDEVDSMKEEVMEALADEKRKSDELHKASLEAVKTDLYKRGWNAAMKAMKDATKALVSHPLNAEGEEE